jgi:hypothetical protein
MSTPLLGHDLVRLLYLDETGTSRDATFIAVAGVIVHGDRQWPKIEQRVVDLIEKYIPPADRLGFVFHATDIFHGAKDFGRRKPEWETRERRFSVLYDLAKIIADLELPVVLGSHKKDEYGRGILSDADEGRLELKANIIHNNAVIDCLMWADKWLERFAPNELATVIHEDGSRAKKLIQACVEMLRSKEKMISIGFNEEKIEKLGLPLKRVIDSVNFTKKSGARPLQLADLCAFLFGRFLQGKPIPGDVFDIIWKRVEWFMPSQAELLRALREEAATSGGLPVRARDQTP